MGLTGGFRQSVARRAIKHDLERSLKADPMTDRDIDWFNPHSSPQNRPDHLAGLHQRFPGATSVRQRLMYADQARFSDPDTGDAGLGSQPAFHMQALIWRHEFARIYFATSRIEARYHE